MRRALSRAGRGRNGAQLLELGKEQPQNDQEETCNDVAMEPSFWSWEKEQK